MGMNATTDAAAATYRRATHDDYDDVAAFTEDTWGDRHGSDYIPRIYHDWIEADDPERHDKQYTCVAEVDGTVVSVAQIVRLSEHEAWCQGMRTDPEYRGVGIGKELTHEMWDWARDRGATVARNMVFSWNVAGLGHSRAVGFAPATEFRWAHPTPDADAAVPDGYALDDDVNAAWSYWTRSDARDHLRGLGLTADESWAVSELTRDSFADARDDRALLVARTDQGTRGVTYRVRDYEREDDDGVERQHAEYGVAAWESMDALRTLLAGVARDAAGVGADETRVLVPETARHVSDVSLARTEISDEPDFVMAADLTADYRADAHLD